MTTNSVTGGSATSALHSNIVNTQLAGPSAVRASLLALWRLPATGEWMEHTSQNTWTKVYRFAVTPVSTSRVLDIRALVHQTLSTRGDVNGSATTWHASRVRLHVLVKNPAGNELVFLSEELQHRFEHNKKPLENALAFRVGLTVAVPRDCSVTLTVERQVEGNAVFRFEAAGASGASSVMEVVSQQAAAEGSDLTVTPEP